MLGRAAGGGRGQHGVAATGGFHTAEGGGLGAVWKEPHDSSCKAGGVSQSLGQYDGQVVSGSLCRLVSQSLCQLVGGRKIGWSVAHTFGWVGQSISLLACA
jgi:hypothetical protein